MNRELLDPKRERHIETPFGFVPCRLLTDGHLRRMSLAEAALYLYLTLAADRRGLSFCRDAHLYDVLKLDKAELGHARRALRQKQLLAFKALRGAVTYQVLALPHSDVYFPNKTLRPQQRRPQHKPPQTPTHTVPAQPFDLGSAARAMVATLSHKASHPLPPTAP